MNSSTSLSYPERPRDRPKEVSAAGSKMNTVPIPADALCIWKMRNEMVS